MEDHMMYIANRHNNNITCNKISLDKYNELHLYQSKSTGPQVFAITEFYCIAMEQRLKNSFLKLQKHVGSFHLLDLDLNLFIFDENIKFV